MTPDGWLETQCLCGSRKAVHPHAKKFARYLLRHIDENRPAVEQKAHEAGYRFRSHGDLVRQLKKAAAS